MANNELATFLIELELFDFGDDQPLWYSTAQRVMV